MQIAQPTRRTDTEELNERRAGDKEVNTTTIAVAEHYAEAGEE